METHSYVGQLNNGYGEAEKINTRGNEGRGKQVGTIAEANHRRWDEKSKSQYKAQETKITKIKQEVTKDWDKDTKIETWHRWTQGEE